MRKSPRLVRLVALVLLAAAGVWLVSQTGASGARDPDREVLELYRRGVREYDKRTAAGTLEAIALFAAAIERDSGYAPAWNGLAQAHSRAYQLTFAVPGVSREAVLQTAIAAADRAVMLDSSSAESWLTRAILSQEIDPVDLAPMYRFLTRALALDSSLAEAWHHLALYHANQGDLASAMETWRRIVRTDPAYVQGLTFLGIGHAWRGNHDSAAFWADSALKVESNYMLARAVAGHAALDLGDFARAEAAFESARRLASDVERTNMMAGLALVLASSGRRSDARKLLRQVDSLAAEKTPLSLHSAVFLAQAHTGLGESAQALEWIRRYQPQGDRHFQLHLRCDARFIPLRTLPAFRALVVIPAPPGNAGC